MDALPILVLLILSLVSAQVSAQSLMVNGLCLTLGQQSTPQLSQCAQYPAQMWDFSSGDRIQQNGYCLDSYPGALGGLVVNPCNYQSISQTWSFLQDGRIASKANPAGCLSVNGQSGAMLYLSQCGAGLPTFFTMTPRQSPIMPYQSYQQPQGPAVQYAPPLSQVPMQGYTPQAPPQPVYTQPQPQPPIYQPQPQYAPPPVQVAPVVQAPQIPVPVQPAPVQQTPVVVPQVVQAPPPQVPQVPVMTAPVQQSQVQPAYVPPSQPQSEPQSEAPIREQIAEMAKVTPQADLSQDHYLCTCIVDANSNTCNEAVRAACLVGHLNEHSCRASFSKNDHDRIADEILEVIENGARCSNFDLEQLKREAQTKPKDLPKGAFQASQDGTPTTDDHYLCSCIEEKASEKCLAAVKAACLVGHIPSGDCYASLNENDHDAVTDHILRLIDSGAGCSNRLQDSKLGATKDKKVAEEKASKQGYVSRMFSKTDATPTKKDKDLCTCLDDHESAPCSNAIKKACKKGHIPKEDCQVAESKKYMGGVTKHALKLIDHGAQCPAHRSMTFSNHGCHCLQKWSHEGKEYSFPNNCVDPDGKKGYPFCKTYSNEHCAGVEGSIEWDRCDNPRFPVKRDEKEVNGGGVAVSDDRLNEADHYLCICISDTSTDEVCVAAVKAACEVGHLPAQACRASLENQDHAAVSDMVIKLLKGGARCGETLAQQGIVRAQPGETKCPEGYYGFPNCRKKMECQETCQSGYECDFMEGKCKKDGQTQGDDEDGGSGEWRLGSGAVYLLLFAGLSYAVYTGYRKVTGGEFSAADVLKYQRLAQNPLGMGGSSGKGDNEYSPASQDDAIAMSTDLGNDDFDEPDLEEQLEEEAPKKDKKKKKGAQQEHTGLAV